MPKKTWAASTSRKDFMDGYGEDYHKSRLLGKKGKDEFFEKFFHDYFKKYHWSLDDKEEPSPGTAYAEPETREGQEAKEKAIQEKKKVSSYYFSSFFPTLT
jgi:hypothetical protein